MCRLPLLALAALLSAPQSSEALSCYQCSDLSVSGQQGFDHPVSKAAKLPCATFDRDNSSYRMEPCVAPFDKSCIQLDYEGGFTVRGCYNIPFNNCTITEQLKECICTTDFCNSAGLATPALLLLLPTALLAAAFSRQ